MTPIESPLCARCGHAREAHVGLSYADGPLIRGSVLVCPTATFSAWAGPRAVDAPTQLGEDKRSVIRGEDSA